jgi:hypothetical protein
MSQAGSFLARLVRASGGWTEDQRRQFRDFFCSGENDRQLMERLGLSGAELTERRQSIAKLVLVTA